MSNISKITTISSADGRLNFFDADGVRIYSLLANDVTYHYNDSGWLIIEDRYDQVTIPNDVVGITPAFADIPALLSAAFNSGSTHVQITGETDNGDIITVPVTQEGHLQMAIHEPLLPFGSVHVESMTPIFQTDAVYGVNDGQVQVVTSGSGAATASDSSFVVGTGTTILSQGVLLGRKRLRYRPGQGGYCKVYSYVHCPCR